MVFIILIETILIILMAAFIIRGFMSLKAIREQLQALKKTKRTNAVVRNVTGNGTFDGLINDMNEVLVEDKKRIEDVERSMVSIRETISELSHDLRTPLTSAGGYAEMLRSISLTEEEKSRYLDVIIERQNTTNHLINQLYYYSRLKTDSVKLENEELDLRKIVTSVIALYYVDFEKQKTEPEVDIDEKKMPVMGDKDGFTRIFSNIISNALSHGEGSYRISLKDTDEGYLFSMTNRASKMTAEDAEKVFERYFTKDPVRTGSNSGLGLTISKTLTERMGGSIKAALEDGIFRIEVLFQKSCY